MSPPSKPPSDAELATQHRDGDDQAFSQLMERYAPQLIAYARRLTGNDADAQDIAQETFVRLYQNMEKLDFSQPLKPWLYRVCTNLCRNLAKRKRSTLFSELENDDDSPSFIESLQDNEPTPAEALLRSVRAQTVRQAIAALPQKYQVVTTLFYWEGLSYEEIASVLSLPLNTVRTHLKRARDHLHTSLSALL
ncbi:MAG: sigma-70 family RNA polymerase sigma factor [Candidatus Peribacteraceae bacterium]|jgi:RNA polymerase sigma-70 factor (ECF subfamily)